MLPIGVHAEALEALALHVDVLLGPLAATGGAAWAGSIFAIFSAEGLLHHVLDGLAVAVLTRHVRREEAALRMGLVHEVLEDLVEGVTDVNGAVGIRRAVVQHEGLAVGVLLRRQLPQSVGHGIPHGKSLAEGKKQIENDNRHRSQISSKNTEATEGDQNETFPVKIGFMAPKRSRILPLIGDRAAPRRHPGRSRQPATKAP